MNLKNIWVKRDYRQSFFHTLGQASYLDAGDDVGLFKQKAFLINPLMEAHFNFLYSVLINRLEELLGCKVKHAKHLPRPGFHIFGSCINLKDFSAKKHFDLQYQKVGFSLENLSDVISFTLPIDLPSEGGGLNIWDVDYQKFHSLSEQEKIEIASDDLKTYIPYKLGHLVLHKGLILHQIASSKCHEGQYRITLQGHGVKVDDMMWIYW